MATGSTMILFTIFSNINLMLYLGLVLSYQNDSFKDKNKHYLRDIILLNRK